MMVIGLTGSIAMGKSEVSRIFRELGIPVFDADQEVHELYESEQGAQMVSAIAPAAVTGHRVDRQVLSQLILADASLLQQLEPVIHAEIASRRAKFRKEADDAGHGIVVYDIPLLLEKESRQDVDVVVVVSAPAAIQRQRALARTGMTEQKLDMILSRQMPDHEKRKRADHVIENNGSLGELRQSTGNVLTAIRKAHAL